MASEKRLIDANALIEEIERIYSEHYAQSTYQFIHDFFKAILRRIRREPTVDAVEVVRCGKCKWYDPESACCKFWHGSRHPGHYCGEGKVKDNELV